MSELRRKQQKQQQQKYIIYSLSQNLVLVQMILNLP